MRYLGLLFLVPSFLAALVKEPWLTTLWEFQFESAYTYSHYNKVANATRPLHGPANDQVLYVDLGVAPSGEWAVDIDLEAVAYSQGFQGLQGGAVQFRRLWLDDIIGDIVTLTTGVSARGVASHALKDVSCPYHSYFDAEMNLAIGKELVENLPYWGVRGYGYGAFGMANKGFPWTRGRLELQFNQRDHTQFRVFADGYFGLGNQNQVNINHFHSYAKVHHKSVDVGCGFFYYFDVWGSLGLEYTHRVYAHAFPERVNFVTLRYHLPFSLF